MLDIYKIRTDFPILDKKINNEQLVYLDNAATTHKPRKVLNKLIEFYTDSYSNIHRGVHYLSKQASLAYENARYTVKRFINAESRREIIFTSSTTESINLVASSFGDTFVSGSDEIIISEMEHHSNIIPWQRLCKKKRATLKVIPFGDNGSLMMERLNDLITQKTKLIAITHVSNALGIVNPIKEIVQLAHTEDIPVLVDGAQSIQHMPVDVKNLDCDFFVFSGHKMYAATGIGILYGKEKWLEAMPPYQTGGGMIESVTFDKTEYTDLPLKFEAGTTNIAGAVSVKTAIEYIDNIGFDEITAYEDKLLSYLKEELSSCEGITIYAESAPRCAVISFNLNNIHPFDAGMILDEMGIAVRTGTHCAEPVCRHYGISGTIRASLALYNTEWEIDRLITGIRKAQNMMKVI